MQCSRSEKSKETSSITVVVYADGGVDRHMGLDIEVAVGICFLRNWRMVLGNEAPMINRAKFKPVTITQAAVVQKLRSGTRRRLD